MHTDTPTNRPRRLFLLACTLTAGFAIGPVAAEDFPSHPIEVVTHSGIGGGTDITARMMMVEGPGAVGGEMVVANKVGGSGAAALQYAASRERDGHTIMLLTQTHILTMIRNKNTGVAFEDLVAVARATDDPQMLMVGKGSPYAKAEDLIAVSKGKALKYGATGIGSGDHISIYTFAKTAGIQQPVIVPFRGGGDITINLVSGNIDAGLSNYSEAEGQIKSGDIRVLMVFGDKRVEQLPDVPTAKELGIDVNLSTVRGFVVLKGTPGDRVKKLEEGVVTAMKGDLYQNFLRQSGATADSVVGHEEWQKQLDELYKQSKEALEALGLAQ